MLELLTAENVVQMCEGEASSQFNAKQLITQVSIDSRDIGKHSLFIALVGEKTDGHNYVKEVVAAGGFALVNREFSGQLANLIRVADTTLGLGLLATNYRKNFKLPVVAISGSNGKTTVKEMLKAVCSCQFGADAVLATSGNLNNHLGMPLTLLKLRKTHQVAILEMGMNHAGELDYLSNLAKPTVAAINNVMFAHAGHFKSLSDIAAAKSEIFNGLDSSGMACLDLSNPFSSQWHEKLNQRQVPVFSYASPASGCYLQELSAAGGSYITPKGQVTIKLQILGPHNYNNALTVIALSLQLGCSLAAIKSGLENYTGYSGRLEPKTAFNGALIIDDTYNANPGSVKAALAAIQGLSRPYWFVFADLKELGSDEESFHQQIGELLADYQIDKLLTVGQLAGHAAKFYNGDKIHFASNQDIVNYCQSFLPVSATLLVKGSNSMQLQEVVRQLTLNSPSSVLGKDT